MLGATRDVARTVLKKFRLEHPFRLVWVALSSPKRRWNRQLTAESDYWTRYFEIRGNDGSTYEGHLAHLNPDYPLEAHIAAAVGDVSGDTIRLLDVGAGPATRLGRVWKGKPIDVTAVDPLANDYDAILRKAGINLPVRTQEGTAEKLSDTLPENHFDLVYARNSIDHVADPRRAFREMLKVVKPGCVVMLEHSVNEAKSEGFKGLHQWNFREENGDFVISRVWRKWNITKELGALCTIECSIGGENGDMIVTKMRKRLR